MTVGVGKVVDVDVGLMNAVNEGTVAERNRRRGVISAGNVRPFIIFRVAIITDKNVSALSEQKERDRDVWWRGQKKRKRG
jgi:hypothetical protein